jgi:ferric-dicitrate binding protein FerR (iron transport regulator)
MDPDQTRSLDGRLMGEWDALDEMLTGRVASADSSVGAKALRTAHVAAAVREELRYARVSLSDAEAGFAAVVQRIGRDAQGELVRTGVPPLERQTLPLGIRTLSRTQSLGKQTLRQSLDSESSPIGSGQSTAPFVHQPPRRVSNSGRFWGKSTANLRDDQLRGTGVRAVITAVSVMSVVIVASLWWRTPASQSVAVYRTPATERATVRLPNGNRVLLAPQSTLTLQGTQATLSGEALFMIRHRENTPFVVRAGPVTVRVLGTAFDVRHYAGERDTRVAVTEGKIELRTGAHPGGRAITMAAGRMASVSDSAVVLTNEVTNATRWTTGELVFTKASVRDVLRIASHWYGYIFRLAGRDSLTLSQRHITVVFDERSVADAVRVLGGLLNATATVDSTGPGTPTITLRVDASVRASPAVAPERRDLHDAFTTSREKGR